ncbi:endonuclease domain-containing protein [Gemmata sp. JC673]|uniref:Endonuclease domain-containing protein n=1 Tax=Gemmata algarum TaxID=2975278 RepID=A0ABU5EXQ2_9BACT|nr:DUF559 domain-containing protein [Gemmata algarum]MDY3558419.1 endonuclease domain-containing protein [Gemmata algarum]
MSTVPTAESFLRHHARTAQGVPTIAVLVGPVGLGRRAWGLRVTSAPRPHAVAATVEPHAVLTAWVAVAFGAADAGALAVRWVERCAGSGAAVVTPSARPTLYDLDVLWRGLPIDPRSPAATAARLLLSDRAQGAATDPPRFVREVAGASGAPGRVVRAVADLYPPELWPALLLTPPPGTLPAALRLLEAVAVTEPRVPVGVAVARDEYDQFAAQFEGTRAAALAREGFIEVRGVAGNDLDARLRAAGLEPPVATVARLVNDGVADDVAAAFVGAARAVRAPAPADLASDFRSVHEEFLFGQLESLSETAGLFRPNQPLPFQHGNQTAEADLLAAGLKLAVEVDGAFYHLNPEQYRRDRRKDHLYQKHGYRVLRFLAEDVVTDLERILNTILEVVAEGRGPAQPTGAA